LVVPVDASEIWTKFGAITALQCALLNPAGRRQPLHIVAIAFPIPLEFRQCQVMRVQREET
jgi:hypothetical protein